MLTCLRNLSQDQALRLDGWAFSCHTSDFRCQLPEPCSCLLTYVVPACDQNLTCVVPAFDQIRSLFRKLETEETRLDDPAKWARSSRRRKIVMDIQKKMDERKDLSRVELVDVGNNDAYWSDVSASRT